MVYKDAIGEYPLLDYPCEYWWVRYGTGCTYLTDAQKKIWEPKLKEMQQKYNFWGYSYSGDWKSDLLEQPNVVRRLFVFTKKSPKGQVEITNQLSELYKILEKIIEGEIAWGDCPYQMEHQSVCPFYKKNEFYASKSLEELRTYKGYEL